MERTSLARDRAQRLVEGSSRNGSQGSTTSASPTVSAAQLAVAVPHIWDVVEQGLILKPAPAPAAAVVRSAAQFESLTGSSSKLEALLKSTPTVRTKTAAENTTNAEDRSTGTDSESTAGRKVSFDLPVQQPATETASAHDNQTGGLHHSVDGKLQRWEDRVFQTLRAALLHHRRLSGPGNTTWSEQAPKVVFPAHSLSTIHAAFEAVE